MKIVNDCLNCIGIYKITNTINGKFYIGSAAISFKKRYKDHISALKNNKHRNRHLQHSFKKYGLDCFIFEIVEVCKKEEIITKEQYYIDTLNPHYNIARNVTSPMLGRKMNEESLARMSKARKGKKFSKEHIEALSKVRKGFDSPKRREVRKKMHKKQKIKIEAIDLTTNEITEHNSIHECSINLGLDATCISRVLAGKNGRSQHSGYTFRYVNKENNQVSAKHTNPRFGISSINKGGYVVTLNGKYRGYFKTLELAIENRDKALRNQ